MLVEDIDPNIPMFPDDEEEDEEEDDDDEDPLPPIRAVGRYD